MKILPCWEMPTRWLWNKRETTTNRAQNPPPQRKGVENEKLSRNPLVLIFYPSLLVLNLLLCRIKLLCTFLMNLQCIFRHCIIRRLRPYHLRHQFRSISRHCRPPALHYIHRERPYIILVSTVLAAKNMCRRLGLICVQEHQYTHRVLQCIPLSSDCPQVLPAALHTACRLPPPATWAAAIQKRRLP